MQQESMNTMIMKVINQNLPEATAKTLRTYLDDAEATKDKLKVCQLTIEERDKTIKNLIFEKSELSLKVNNLESKESSVIKRELDVSVREKEVEKRELRAEINELKAKMEREKCEEIKELASIVFRNKVLVTESYSTPLVRTNYNSVYNNATGSYENQPGGEYVETHETIKRVSRENE